MTRWQCGDVGISRWVRLDFFDLENRCAGLDLHGDPLVAINAAVHFEMFRLKLKMALIKDGLRPSEADRKAALATRPAPLLAIEENCITPRDWLKRPAKASGLCTER